MKFNKHFDLQGRHAFLSASKYHWVNYDTQKLTDSFLKYLAVQRGTELHEYAATSIRLKQRFTKNGKALNTYINDAIGFRMTPEQTLYYSDNAFGTADAISFRGKTLRIHDLKTGVSPVSFQQLKIYAAYFCLEYGERPEDITIELRIYQDQEDGCVLVSNPTAEEIDMIMKKIILFDKQLDKLVEDIDDGQ